ncbi:MAG: hypothetical protein ABIY55_18390 [Kofleriaceae bacterium]
MMSRGVWVLLVACGGSGGEGGTTDVTPFIGVYTTTSHARAEMPGGRVSCTSAGDPVTGATPFVRLAVDTFFMDPDILSVSNCEDAAATRCTETQVTLHAGGAGLEDESANSQTGGGVMCQLYYSHASATLTGGMLQVEALDKFDAPNIASSDCTLARAEALASSSECQRVERWAGTRL